MKMVNLELNTEELTALEEAINGYIISSGKWDVGHKNPQDPFSTLCSKVNSAVNDYKFASHKDGFNV